MPPAYLLKHFPAFCVKNQIALLVCKDARKHQKCNYEDINFESHDPAHISKFSFNPPLTSRFPLSHACFSEIVPLVTPWKVSLFIVIVYVEGCTIPTPESTIV